MPKVLHAKEGEELAGECRRCATYCDRLIEPWACIEMRCPYLYSYIARADSREYMGCMQKVFAAEIDVRAFREAERAGGWGQIKMTGEPLAHCQFTVEPCFEGDGPEHECTNPEFFAVGEAEFDLRNALV